MKHIFSKRFFSSAIGIAALFVILVVVNWAAQRLYLRRDITEDRLYTLSQGTLNMLEDVPEPVTLKLFYSDQMFSQQPFIKAFANRVKDLLREYETHSGGEITLEVIDPAPLSDEEEWAQKYGVVGSPINPMAFDEMAYFGLVAEVLDRHATIPVLAPERERFLEYDVSRMIFNVLHPDKQRVAVLSSLPVMGFTRQPYMPRNEDTPEERPAWGIIQEMQQTFDVVEMRTNAPVVPAGTDVLMVIHPKNLADETLFAIDQYVLGGGKAIFYVDPFCNVDVSPGPMMNMAMPGRSSLNTLFRAWGVEVPEQQIVADMDNATTVSIGPSRAERSPVWISVGEETLNQDSPVSADLDLMVFPVAGHVITVPSVTNDVVPLVQSSENCCDVDMYAAQYGAEQVRSQFTAAMEPMTLAAMVSGRFKSAFPDGAPEADGPTNTLTHSTGISTVIIVADVDILADEFNYRDVNFLGMSARQQFNNNADFALNAVDQMGGDDNLISIRSRKKFQRPFTVVQDLERDAQDRWLAKEQELTRELQTVRQTLNQLQMQKDESQRYVLSDEQREQIEQFRARQAEIARELKDVQKNLRKDIDALGYRLQFYNLALVPLGVCVFGLTFAFYRQAKVKRS